MRERAQLNTSIQISRTGVMADSPSITASIIAVLLLTSTVLKYLIDVKGASADFKSFIRDISSTPWNSYHVNETMKVARVSDET
jgi:hypothetical protein